MCFVHIRPVQQNRETLATVLEAELIEGDGWVPLSAIAGHGIEYGEEFPHACDHGNLRRFALCPEASIEDADYRVVLGGAEDAQV